MSIPVDSLVPINPGVISGGGTAEVLNGVLLSQNPLIPTGSVLPFANPLAVQNYFGIASAELTFAKTYFLGNNNSTQKPSNLFIAPYIPSGGVAAWLQSGSLAGVTLAQLQAYSGTLSAVVDGYSRGGGSLNLSSASSFSAAATSIQTLLNTSPATQATSSAVTISGTTATVGGTITGAFAVGQTLLGTGVTANSVITAQLTGTAGAAGTYSLSQSSTVGSSIAATTTATPVVVTWNALNSTFLVSSGFTGVASTIAYATGTVAASLLLTSATGGILSQGAAADTPATAMANVVKNTRNWATYTSLIEPNLAGKEAHATWVNAQNQKYLYVPWDTDGQAIVANSTSCFGYFADLNEYNAVMPVYNNSASAAFIMGMIASINFSATSGRITLAYKAQAGLTPVVTDATIAANLLSNNYNFYGNYATANDNFNFLQPGSVSGEWTWADTYVNQIYFNSQFQLALVELAMNTNSIPYDQSGYDLVEAALKDPINAMGNFGAFQTGVKLSAAEAAEVNAAAGKNVTGAIQSNGYYIQVLDPGAQARTARTSPTINFWYTDGGSIQKFTVASVDIQ
jgi:hypothetical protein